MGDTFSNFIDRNPTFDYTGTLDPLGVCEKTMAPCMRVLRLRIAFGVPD